MKIFNNCYFVILLSIVVGAMSSSLIVAMNESIKQAPAQSLLPLNKWTNDQLLEIASFIKEQRHWVLMMDAIVHDIPDQELNDEIKLISPQVRLAAKNLMAQGGFASVDMPNEQKEKGLKLFFGLFECINRNKKSSFAMFVDSLARYDIEILRPLRQLTALIHHQNNVPNTVIAKELMNTYEQLVPAIKKDVQTYKMMVDQLKQVFNSIIEELIFRTYPLHAELIYNIFTGASFVTEVVDQAEIGQLILSVTVESEKKMDIDIDKLNTNQLHEIASLLHEQSYLVMFLDAIINKVPLAQINPMVKNACELMHRADMKATAIEHCLFGEYASLADHAAPDLYNAFSRYFDGIKDEASRLFKLLSDYSYRDFAPLCKLIQQYKTVKSYFCQLMKRSVDITPQEQSILKQQLQESISAIHEIIHQHGSMHAELNSLYTKIMSKLKSRKNSRIVRQSIFSKRFMPATYCNTHEIDARPTAAAQAVHNTFPVAAAIAQPPVINKKIVQKACSPAAKQKKSCLLVPRAKSERSLLDIYAWQEYFLKNASNPVYFSQKPACHDALVNDQSFSVD